MQEPCGVHHAAVKRENGDDEDVEQAGTVEDAAAAAIAAQPTGFTLATTNVQTEVTRFSVRYALQLPNCKTSSTNACRAGKFRIPHRLYV